jgi:hypothetical protein
MSKQVLVSHGYGAGWSSWAGSKAQAIAEYAPIVEYVAAGNPVLSGKPRRYVPTDEWESTPWDEKEDWLHDNFRPLVKQMMDELELDRFFTGGADGLTVESVSGPYRIDEYDGFESVTSSEDLWR